MRYNLIISTFLSTYNILLVNEENLLKIIDAYNRGSSSFFIDGERYSFERLRRIKIYTYEGSELETASSFYEYAESKNWITRGYMNISSYIDDDILRNLGKDVTKDFIKNDFGNEKKDQNALVVQIQDYVNSQRIEELRNLNIEKFDLIRLIALCSELNLANSNGMFLSIPILIRAIIDHIPPLFEKSTFSEMTGSVGSKSFQEVMLRLDKSSRKIADSFLHQQIRNKEVLPNETQVNFKNEIDVLLAEIIRRYK
ncbi:MAG: hypothetical protein WCY89_00455 [Flavobacteriaceae bacterium]